MSREPVPPAAVLGELRPYSVPVVVVDADPGWADGYRAEHDLVVRALGPTALAVDHVGSTSVPGLPAKPVIDVLLQVPDSADEASYVPALEAVGHVLRVREPDWLEHRVLYRRRVDGAPRDVNVHVLSPGLGAVEVARMLTFRDWLRTHPDDRDRYAAVKRGSPSGGGATCRTTPTPRPLSSRRSCVGRRPLADRARADAPSR
jgi:GrpB-like predicted nucleotidyltransferase (UPF0157 family)